MNQKLDFQYLVLEVTRRCNMSCRHCLRGNAEEKDMSFETIKPLLDHTKGISQLTFSGGEPTLNIPLMQQVLTYVKEKKIPVYSFYLVTNGKEVSDEFLVLLHKWFAYCMDCGGDDFCFGISLSKDMFHDEIPKENEQLLRQFASFRDDKITDWGESYLLRTGRAASLKETAYKFIEEDKNKDLYVEEWDFYFQVDECYVSVAGDITASCNLSYKDMPNCAVGNTKDMDSFFKYLKKVAE